MNYFRQLLKHKRLVSLLSVAMLLRALIAPGFMLDVNAATPSFFSIVVCHGHQASGRSSLAGDNVEGTNAHDPATQADRFSACGFWSLSGKTLATGDSVVMPMRLSRHVFELNKEPYFAALGTSQTFLARAPPLRSC